MPGDVYLSDYDYSAGFGYSGQDETQAPPHMGMGMTGGSNGTHTSFVIWLLVLSIGSVMILHGLRLGGFTFVFRR